jgi:peptidoglycan/LPS O-acetylase OafA/YrhL
MALRSGTVFRNRDRGLSFVRERNPQRRTRIFDSFAAEGCTAKAVQSPVMGLLRMLLALGVVRGHRPFFDWFFLVEGGVAVIFFYIISGFYMSMVIRENYSKLGKGWEKLFLLNRALRLYPAYWVVLVFSIIMMAVFGTPTLFTSQLGLTGFERGLGIFCNTFIVGLDVLVSGGTLNWHDGHGGLVLSWQMFPVFIGWTVAVELTFYVLAAFFIMRDRRIAMFALALGIYIRVWFLLINGKDLGFSVHGIGYSNYPWGYHFFGTDLIFFMFGYLAYEMYLILNERLNKDPAFIKKIWAMVGVLTAILLGECYAFQGFQTIWDFNDHRLWAAIPFFVLLVAPLFIVTKRSRIDEFLGLFSYPIYLCHVIATDVGTNIFHMPSNKYTTAICILVASLILIFAVEKPIDAYRHRLTLKHRAAAAASDTA